MSNVGVLWAFTYDANGMRIGRTDGSSDYTYIYNNGQLARMTKGNATLYFTYDAAGTPLTVNYNGVTYYYVTNLQGDVIAILDSTGNAVAEYSYNAWGYPVSTTGDSDLDLHTLNPLRYRSYIYDEETGLYYLQSRYYNPEIGRFISADSYASTGQGLLGNNMFAYCNNNPVNGCDPCGTCIHYWFLLGLIDCEDCKKGPTWIDRFRNPDGSYSYTDNKRDNPNRLYHEQTMVLSASGTSIDLPNGDCTLGSVDLTVLTGGWEFDTWDLSLFDVGRAQAGLGFEDGTFYASAIASIWSPSVTWSMWGINISVSAHVGSVGAEWKLGKGGFKLGAASAWGASISVSWD